MCRLSADRPEAAEEDEEEQPEEGETAVPPEEDGESDASEIVSVKDALQRKSCSQNEFLLAENFEVNFN